MGLVVFGKQVVSPSKGSWGVSVENCDMMLDREPGS